MNKNTFINEVGRKEVEVEVEGRKEEKKEVENDYLNALSVLNKFKKKDSSNYEDFMKGQTTSFVGQMAHNEDISWLQTLKVFVDISLTNLNLNKSCAQSMPVDTSPKKINQTVWNGNKNPILNDKSVDNIIVDSPKKVYSRKDPKESVQKDNNLALKNSWSDKLNTKYKISNLINNGEGSINITISDFSDIDFGPNHGMVHNCRTPYRWDATPKSAIIFFLNWALRRSPTKIYFFVPNIFSDQSTVKVLLSTKSFQKFRNQDNPEYHKTPKGLVENDVEIKSIGSENSWASRVSNKKFTQVKSDEVKSDEVKSDEVKSDKVKSGEVKSDEVKSGEVKSDDVKPSEVISTGNVFGLAEGI